jgi:cytochrome c biogenesis protein CcdA
MSATERPISAILREIVRNLQEIMRAEIHLAKTEVREELTKTRSAGLLIALGAASALFSVFFSLLTLVYALSLVLPEWAAALCVAAGIGVVAVLTMRAGLTRLEAFHAGTPKTVASMKENVKWTKRESQMESQREDSHAHGATAKSRRPVSDLSAPPALF